MLKSRNDVRKNGIFLWDVDDVYLTFIIFKMVYTFIMKGTYYFKIHKTINKWKADSFFNLNRWSYFVMRTELISLIYLRLIFITMTKVKNVRQGCNKIKSSERVKNRNLSIAVTFGVKLYFRKNVCLHDKLTLI